jgi:hypothetical protein
MLLVNQGFGTIPACLMLPLKGKGTNDAGYQSSKIFVIDKQRWACQRGSSLQLRRKVLQPMMTPAVVAMRVCQSA